MSDSQKPAATGHTIPVTWKTGDKQIAGKPLQVVAPNAGEIGAYGNVRAATCGQCRKFHHRDGQVAMEKQKFLGRLVWEELWKVKHLGAPPETFGLCGETNGDTITSAFTPACEHFKPDNGRVRR